MDEITSTTFKKTDFLNAVKLSEKFGVPVEEIEQTLKKHYRQGTKFQFKVNNIITRTEKMVYEAKWGHRTQKTQKYKLVLHPMALKQFTELLGKDK